MLLWIAGGCTLIFDDEIADKLGDQSADCELATFWFDGDSDGYGNAADSLAGCEQPSHYVDNSDDCDDSNDQISPDAVETCDGFDQDCDGAADDVAWYADADRDGFGDADTIDTTCIMPSGYVANGSDCDDTDSAISPDGTEVCGGADEDCDTLTDDDDPNVLDPEEWYLDADGDGFGTSAKTEACEQPRGYSATDGDCNDGDDEISPDGVETCDDGTDQDCDGTDAACSSGGDYTTDWGSEMIAISAGSFTMGGGAGDPDGSYVDHVVTLTHDFWMGETEITRGQWESSPANASWTYSSMPSYPCTTSTTTDDCPADSMSWYDVAKYANALSAQEGLTACYLADGSDLAAAYLADPYACPGYRMPTEAEWEYAARAGQNTEFAGSSTVGAVAWYSGNAYYLGTYAHQVATLAPNAWGLYDMSGNVWEWTNDWYDASYGGYGNRAAQTDPRGPNSGSGRVNRGGDWSNGASDVRVAFRSSNAPDGAYGALGARLSRSNP